MSEIQHLLKKENYIGTQEWDDMFNTDNTNEVARHQRRYNNYTHLFGNNSDFKEPDDDPYIVSNNLMMNSDNTNQISSRAERHRNSYAYNGIIDLTNVQTQPHQLFKGEGEGTVGNTISKTYTPSPLSRLYFSNENIDNIQSQIRYQVWLRSGKRHTIGKQSTTQLEIIMRSIFLQFSENRNTHLKEQVDQLNSYVVEYSVPSILSSVEQYIHYRKDISTLPTVMDYPQNMSIAGEKSLKNKAWF